MQTKQLDLWLCITVGAMTFSLAASSSQAAETDLAGACLGCHAPGKEQFVDLYQQSQDQLYAKLIAYRDDTSQSTLMGRLAKGYSNPELKALAKHFGQQERIKSIRP